MISAIGHECQPASIRRPSQVALLAPIEEQALGLAAIERRDPNMIVLDVGDLTASRNHRRIAFVDLYRRTATGGHGPYRRDRLHRRGAWIGRQISFGRPVGIMIAAQHKHEARAVGRKRKLGYFLPVIVLILGDVARGEARAPRQPNVAHPVQIAHPGNHVAVFRRCQFRGKWVMQHLRHGELGARARAPDCRREHDHRQ